MNQIKITATTIRPIPVIRIPFLFAVKIVHHYSVVSRTSEHIKRTELR